MTVNLDRIDQLIKDDKLFEACKEYRAYAGVGLREAKEYCEARRDKLKNIKRNIK